MKKYLKWIGIAGGTLVAFFSLYLMNDWFLLELSEMEVAAGMSAFCAGAFTMLWLLLGKKNLPVINAFLVTGLNLVFFFYYITYITYYEETMLYVHSVMEALLLLYILLLMFGERFMDRLVTFAAIKDEEGNLKKPDDAEVFDVDAWKKKATAFMNGVCSMVAVFGVIYLYLGVSAFCVKVLASALATILFFNLLVLVWKVPADEK